ncbi:GMC oxidoreductase [Streptomyces sp. YIM 98790]|uniref:GMC family oxidoreductase n=1 Tax=Streptomyces sp. YIM 98790 TaxID=2689077 RepID=UPI00140932B7
MHPDHSSHHPHHNTPAARQARQPGTGHDAEYDYVVVGGGTAGCVIASRLAEDPGTTVALIEGGPSDLDRPEVLTLRRWMGLLGGELDYDYPTTVQPHGNSHIRHSRARVLGGCSSHNTLISFRPLPSDWDEWEAEGAAGWGADAMRPYWSRLRNRIVPVGDADRNAIARDFVAAAHTALGVPLVEGFNRAPFTEGTGFFDLAYHPETNQRSSASVAYLHPHLRAGDRPNLTLLLETWAYRVETERGGRVSGVRVRAADGGLSLLRARREVVLCAGAVDTPRLLLHSGIGPARDLERLDIPVVHDLPGVGENLLDHPESVIVWETHGPIPENSAMDSDAGLFVRRDPNSPGPDLMFHFYQIPFTDNPERLGYRRPPHGVSMTPNIPKPRSRGRLYLTSADPAIKPALDFRYFSDPDGYDARTLVDGIRIAREVARQEPLAGWLKREVCPGPELVTDEELSAYARRAAHTVYHPAGTCRMGAADDRLAVVDPGLRVRGLAGLRIADASVFPTIPAVNPMIGVLMVGEKAADLLRAGDPAAEDAATAAAGRSGGTAAAVPRIPGPRRGYPEQSGESAR